MRLFGRIWQPGQQALTIAEAETVASRLLEDS